MGSQQLRSFLSGVFFTILTILLLGMGYLTYIVYIGMKAIR